MNAKEFLDSARLVAIHALLSGHYTANTASDFAEQAEGVAQAMLKIKEGYDAASK